MAQKTKAELKAEIDLYIRNNGNNEITGDQMNMILNDMVDSASSGSTGDLTSIETAISGETVSRISGDTSLETAINDFDQSSLESEIDDLFQETTSLSVNLSGEISTRTSYQAILFNAQSSLYTMISTETTDRISGDTSLETAIDNFDQSSLETAISYEVSNRISGDTSLESAIDNFDQSSLETAIGGEVSNRISADTSIINLIPTELDDLSDVDIITPSDSDFLIYSGSSFQNRPSLKLEDIVSDGQILGMSGTTLTGFDYVNPTNITSLETDLSTEISNRTSADVVLSIGISTEISTRGSADNVLSTVISTEISNRISGDTSLSTAIESIDFTSLENEITGNTSIINEISNGLSSEISTRSSSDNVLSTTINTEISNRISGDTSLSTAIESIDFTSLENEITGNTSIINEISTEISNTNTSLSTEISTRGSADSILSTGISTEISNRISADTSLESKIPSLGTDNQIPFMNGTTEFQYKPGLMYDDNRLILSSFQGDNLLIGDNETAYNLDGDSPGFNLIIGRGAGYSLNNNLENLFLGNYSGYNNNGNGNLFLGNYSGYNNNGDGNLFLGHSSGYNETGSNMLYISNSDTSTPLIYGEFDNQLVRINGDLQVSGLTNGTTSNVVYYDNSTGELTYGATPSVSLSITGLTDVTITTPTDGEVLTYDSGTWVNNALGTISTKDYWNGTQAEYDGLGTWDSNTIYFINE